MLRSPEISSVERKLPLLRISNAFLALRNSKNICFLLNYSYDEIKLLVTMTL